MGFLSTAFLTASCGTALGWSALRHVQLRRGPRRMHWSASVFAHNGYSGAQPVSTAKITTAVPASAPSPPTTTATTTEAQQQQQRNKKKRSSSNKRKTAASTADEQTQQEQPRFVETDVAFVPPPNSMMALQYAVDQHATGVTVQVRLCRSGELVLFGDGAIGDTMELVVGGDSGGALNDDGANAKAAAGASAEEKWEDNPEEDAETIAKMEAAERTAQEAAAAQRSSLLLDERSFALRAGDGVEDFTLNELRCLTYRGDPARRARILTVEECVNFCREHSLRLVFDVKVAGFGMPAAAAASSKATQDDRGALAKWKQRRADRRVMAAQFKNLYTNNRLDALKFLHRETLVVGSDPFLLYRIRDVDQKVIPVGVACGPHLWTGRVPAPVGSPSFGRHGDSNEARKLLAAPAAATATKDTAPSGNDDSSTAAQSSGNVEVSRMDELLDRALAECNQRITPWIVGASCVAMHHNVFTQAELAKWRQREILLCVTGFHDDPNELPPSLTQADIAGTCIVAAGDYIKFFPARHPN